MRLNPKALALAFGVAKVVVTVFTILSFSVSRWSLFGRVPPPFLGGFDRTWFTISLYEVVVGFVAAAIGGALAAVVYNKVIAKGTQAA
ncbi:MAG TPA: hypothetical protein VFO29_03395 [Candidatus Rubrimentiphilum sp.]|nr:hypothetical protein [Candidatus Rubrimentiphilum sp.]